MAPTTKIIGEKPATSKESKHLNQEPIPAIDPLAESTTTEKSNFKALPPKTKTSTNSKKKSGTLIAQKSSSNRAFTSTERTAPLAGPNPPTQPGAIHVRGYGYRGDSNHSFLGSRRNVDSAIATNDENSNNEGDAAITSATLVIADSPVIIPTATPDDDNNRSIRMKCGRLVVFTLSLLGIVGISVWVGWWRANAGENETNPSGQTSGDESYQEPRIETINNLVMTIKGVPFDDMDSNGISDWENTTSNHIQKFYATNQKSLRINISKTITSVTITGENFVEYNQEFEIQNKSDDETSAEDLAIDPFGSFYDGRELYASALQGIAGVFENITTSSDITINYVTDQPSKMQSSSPIPSQMPSPIPSQIPTVAPTASKTPSAFPTLSFEDKWIEIEEKNSVAFPIRDIAKSSDPVWIAKGFPFDSENATDAGKVALYNNDGLHHEIMGMEDYSYFGNSVAISADATVLAVGAPGGNDYSGLAFIFHRPTTDDKFAIPQQQLNGTERSSLFGYTLAMTPDGKILTVSAPIVSSFSSVFVFQRWTIEEEFVLHQEIDEPESSSDFGHRIDMTPNGKFLVASASLVKNVVNIGPGLVTLFARSETSGFFEEVHEIQGGCDNEVLGYYGVSVGATAGGILVHAKGFGCNLSNRVQSYQLECNCRIEDYVCSGFDSYPDLVCEGVIPSISPAPLT
eukprot:CAMPEP_0194444204 /NCGR_PEP_ID=MMETSP0176-20130528/127134_1 /TAXON_ID=216777 /ORGANISM="Proboscia alata, Strain PI-D3" /LENGTH=687 /DNA_ID=CAMNT_0039270545 /DNA_START=139 /DNA_END=2202 /DNA_ORIENTATION=-